MPANQWTIIDTTNQLVTPPRVRELSVPGAGGLLVRHATLTEGLSHGVDVLEVNNGEFQFRVLPTRGMGIWDATHQGTRIGWKSPVRGPVHPTWVDLGEPSGLGWLDGFDELLVRCGLESNGAPEFDDEERLKFPLHGRIANRPAHHVTVSIDPDASEITIVGVVEETRFHFLKLRMTSTIKTRAGEAGLRIHDEIENLSALPAEFQMLYHVNFGEPLLDSGSRVVAPVKTLVPRTEHAARSLGSWDSYAAPQAGFEEQVYFFELLGDREGRTRALLENAHRTQGVSLIFSTKQLPCFTLWKDTAASQDGYVTGLEPGTNYPNPRSFEGEQGRVGKLAPSARTALDLQLEYHPDTTSVEKAEKAVAAIQGNHAPKIFPTPQRGWCAGV